MLARRLPGILPAMTFDEALEVTKIYSVLGLLGDEQTMMRERPFRAPHHTISDAGLVGGGPATRPGELSLAHHGVLFLDELPEFRKNVLEVLRQPLEEGAIHLARAIQHIDLSLPGDAGGGDEPLPLRLLQRPRAQMHMPGAPHPRLPLAGERTPAGPHRHHPADAPGGVPPHRPERRERSHRARYYRERVEAARERQRVRFRDEPGVYCNAQMPTRLLHRYCKLSSKAQQQLEKAMRSYGLSARAHDRILKLARSRADLEGHERIEDAGRRTSPSTAGRWTGGAGCTPTPWEARLPGTAPSTQRRRPEQDSPFPDELLSGPSPALPGRTSSGSGPVMSRAERLKAMNEYAQLMSTASLLRKPMRKRTWMPSQASHALKPEDSKRWKATPTALPRPMTA